jgi:hypothetical protein
VVGAGAPAHPKADHRKNVKTVKSIKFQQKIKILKREQRDLFLSFQPEKVILGQNQQILHGFFRGKPIKKFAMSST